MKQMTLQQIAQACGGKLVCPEGQTIPDTEAACVVIDSRQIEQDGIFIATKGERVDGHSFIPQVFEKGALGVVCEELPEVLPGVAGYCGILQRTAHDSGGGNHRKCRKDQHQGNDCRSALRKI